MRRGPRRSRRGPPPPPLRRSGSIATTSAASRTIPRAWRRSQPATVSASPSAAVSRGAPLSRAGARPAPSGGRRPRRGAPPSPARPGRRPRRRSAGAGDRGVDQGPGQHPGVRAVADGDDDRDLAALGLVDRDRVGEPQRRGLPVGDLQRPPSSVSTTISSSSGSSLAEEDDRAVHQPEVVRVAGLDQAVADPEAVARAPAAPSGLSSRLEALVEGVDPDRPPVHRRQHLDVADRVDPVAPGRALGDDLDDGGERPLGVGPVDEEEVALLALARLEVRRPAAG